MCSLDSTLRALASRRRRLTLRCLMEHRELALPDLAELVAERESGEPLSALSPERACRVYFSLYHTHLPKLENAGLVRYDQEEDYVIAPEETRAALAEGRELFETLLSE